MEATQEHMKIFLFTGIIAGTAMTILFSSGQFDTTKFDFDNVITADRVNDRMIYLTYSVGNTGNTDIISITVDTDCCVATPANPTLYPLIPGDNTGQISSMLQQVNGSAQSRGDYTMVTLQVEDHLGNKKTAIEPVRLD